MGKIVMKNFKIIILMVIAITLINSAGYASNIPVSDEYDLKLAFNYAFSSNIDTLILTTNGGTYTTQDTVPLVVSRPLTIVTADDVVDKPVIAHLDTSLIEQIIICDDFTVDGVIFEGGADLCHGYKYCMRFRHTPPNHPGGQIFAKTGANITLKNCEFRNYIQDKVMNYVSAYDGYEVGEGHVIKFEAPEAGEPTIQGGTLKFENCKFENIGDEAIRAAAIEKYPSGTEVDRVMDSLIVRNCTFKNVWAECVRIYADDEPKENMQTVDCYLLMDHLTIDNCAPRVVFAKDNANSFFTNSIITNAKKARFYRSDRNDAVVNLQRDGSRIFNVDTFNVAHAIDDFERGDDLHVFELVQDDIGEDTLSIYGFDPMYESADNFDYTLKQNSPAYMGAADGSALGDLTWATNSSDRNKFNLSIEGEGGYELLSPDYFAPTYAADESVTLKAVEKGDTWKFVQWSGDVSGTDQEITFTMDSPKNVVLEFSDEVAIDDTALPYEYSLQQNYPNPFNPATTIAFSIKNAGLVQLSVYNMLGQEVATLINKDYSAGKYTINFDASHLSSGVYFYKLHAGDFAYVRKMILIK